MVARAAARHCGGGAVRSVVSAGENGFFLKRAPPHSPSPLPQHGAPQLSAHGVVSRMRSRRHAASSTVVLVLQKAKRTRRSGTSPPSRAMAAALASGDEKKADIGMPMTPCSRASQRQKAQSGGMGRAAVLASTRVPLGALMLFACDTAIVQNVAKPLQQPPH